MTNTTSNCDWQRFRAYLAYVAICLTVLLGALGARWYLHETSSSLFTGMHKDEEAAGEAHAWIVVTQLVGGRRILEQYHLLIGILVGVCLVAVATGLVKALYRMFLSPSALTQIDVGVCLPRGMLVVLVWQIAALWLAVLLLLPWLR